MYYIGNNGLQHAIDIYHCLFTFFAPRCLFFSEITKDFVCDCWSSVRESGNSLCADFFFLILSVLYRVILQLPELELKI